MTADSTTRRERALEALQRASKFGNAIDCDDVLSALEDAGFAVVDRVEGREDREAHADLRTRFAVALAPAVRSFVGIANGEKADALYDMADTLASEDARRRAEDAKGGE